MDIDRTSLFSSLVAYISPHILPAIGILVALFLIFASFTSYTDTGDMMLNRLESMFSVFTSFFGTIIATCKNGIINITNAITNLIPSIDSIWNGIKDRVGSLIPSIDSIWEGIKDRVGAIIPTIDAIWAGIESRVQNLIPSMDLIYWSIKDRLSTIVPEIDLSAIYQYCQDEIDYRFQGIISQLLQIEDVMNELIHDYVVDVVFEPLFTWVEYTWDDNSSISWNMYAGFQQTVTYFVSKIPVIGWLTENYEKLQALV